MESIKFIKGEETGVVIVRDDFANSWLSDQFSAALHVVDRICTEQQSNILINQDKDESCRVPFNASNIVAFCGDRGEGKTSCMMTVREILSDESVREKYYLNKTNKPKFPLFETISLIEPAFFDKDHNIIELLLGQMFIQFNKRQRKEVDYEKSLCLRNKVREAFCKVQGNLSILHSSSKNPYEGLENLESLAASMQLAESLKELFSIYLQYMDKKDGRLLICIDDIDLNMSEAYLLSEQIRKYLSNEYCVILLALKVEQLQNVVTSHIANEDDKFQKASVYGMMAEKYVTKLLPLQNRIEMPSVEALADKKLIIVTDEERTYPSVKEAVMTLIARRTHYLFYNKKDEVSPLIPRNLRALRHLIGILTEMQKYDYSNHERHADSINDSNKHNQELFRNYLYKVWVSELSQDDKSFAGGLVSMATTYKINKYVVAYLRKRFDEWIRVNVLDASMEKKSESDEDNIEQIEIDENSKKLLKNIFNSESTAYNISAGDVLYVISLFDKRLSDADVKNLLFFIKAYYSIHLYETYNRITETDDMLFPITPEDTDINKEDVLFEHVNAYQKFTNGSTFTFAAGEILPRYRKSDIKIVSPYRDMLKISASKLYEEILIVMQEYDKYERDSAHYTDKDELMHRFQRCEYLLLSTNYSSAYVLDSTDLYVERRSLSPYYTGEYSWNHLTYLVFNPLAIFSNCANVKYTYERLWKPNKDTENVALTFYDYAVKNPYSLLNQMIEQVRTERDYKNMSNAEVEQEKLKLLASNATIRNADIQASILENIRYRRSSIGKDSKSELVLALTNLYKYIIIDTHINYYAKDEEDKNKYAHTTFDFLNAIVTFLKTETDNNFFNYVIEDASSKKSARIKMKVKPLIKSIIQFMKSFDGLNDFLEKTARSKADIIQYMSEHDSKKLYARNQTMIEDVLTEEEYTLQSFRSAIKPIRKKLK